MNGRAVQVAALTPVDWREFKALRLEAFRSEPAAFSTSYDEALARTDEEWRAQLADPRRVVLLAWVSQRPVGMVGAYRGADDGDQCVAIVFGMYVNREFRRQGVGRRLLASLIDVVSGFPQIATIRLWVTEEQGSARLLYESVGFQIVGKEVQNRQGDGRLHDELVMERPAHQEWQRYTGVDGGSPGAMIDYAHFRPTAFPHLPVARRMRLFEWAVFLRDRSGLQCNAAIGATVWRRSKTIKSRWTRVAGLRVHARVALDQAGPDAPAVVLVHGIGVASPYFVPTAEQLAPHFRVYAVDLPGFGLSDKPSHFLDIAELADALAAWMHAEGLERPIVLGNSVGCQIVADFAVRYPEHVSCLILTGPTFDPRARSMRKQIARWLRNSRYERLSQVPLSVRDYWQCGARRLVRTLRYALADRIEEKLPRVQAPALVVRGGNDPIVPQRWAEEAARLLPRGRLAVIPGAGHTVNYNAPGQLARLVRTWVGEQRGVERSGPG